MPEHYKTTPNYSVQLLIYCADILDTSSYLDKAIKVTLRNGALNTIFGVSVIWSERTLILNHKSRLSMVIKCDWYYFSGNSLACIKCNKIYDLHSVFTLDKWSFSSSNVARILELEETQLPKTVNVQTLLFVNNHEKKNMNRTM